MNLILRLIRVIVASRFRERLDILGTSVVSFVVWPHDLDVNVHMNNGRYLTIADLGRIDLVARTGILKLMIRRRWSPVVAMASIRFRASLKPFQRYQLHTRVVCWDEKWVYMEQRFERQGETVALAYVKGLFRARKRTLRSREILAALGQQQRSPHMPPALEALKLAEGLTAEKPGRL